MDLVTPSSTLGYQAVGTSISICVTVAWAEAAYKRSLYIAWPCRVTRNYKHLTFSLLPWSHERLLASLEHQSSVARVYRSFYEASMAGGKVRSLVDRTFS